MSFSKALCEPSRTVSLYLNNESLPFCLIFQQKSLSYTKYETSSDLIPVAL